MSPPSGFFFLAGALLLGGAVFISRFGQRERGLPPGPPTVPILGNLHLLHNSGEIHLKLLEWSRQYGDIISVKIGSGTMVVLSSPIAIKEVIDAHGWAASSRPVNYLAGLAAGGYHILFAPAVRARLRNLKKILARYFSSRNSLKHAPMMSAESTQLLYDLMDSPADFTDSIRRYTHSVAMILVYGQRVPSVNSLRGNRFFQLLHRFLHILTLGVYPPIDMLPILKYLPARWAPWIAACRRSKSDMTALHAEFSEAVEARHAKRIAEDTESNKCFMSDILQMDLSHEEYTGFTLVETGSDTNAAFLLSLVLVLASYPEHQARASQEIEAVVGAARLPELEDFKRMPFVDALVKEIIRIRKEIIRIRPVLPMGVPHLTTEEIYVNYVVPKNTTVILNNYGIFHNPDVFEQPEIFNPNRFMQSEHGTRPGMDTDFRDNIFFGGGRRICPGQWIARATMQLTTMRLIWAFTFGNAVDAQTGLPIPRGLDFYAPEFVVMPWPFRCDIQPRSTERREIVLQAFEDARSTLKWYEGN
ncbi:cytochrome P450 [Mycena sp. CBHHK59/15]|nr:cytochrome P450 [Mycena sp. CBHHK59/15]